MVRLHLALAGPDGRITSKPAQDVSCLAAMQCRERGAIHIGDCSLDRRINTQLELPYSRWVRHERGVQAHEARRPLDAVIQSGNILLRGEIQICKSDRPGWHVTTRWGCGRDKPCAARESNDCGNYPYRTHVVMGRDGSSPAIGSGTARTLSSGCRRRMMRA